jgi:tetratricopeptide (TPR) repeat protein
LAILCQTIKACQAGLKLSRFLKGNDHLTDKALVALLIFSFNPTGASPQEKPPQRHDSVMVSAGISKEQLALEEQLNGVILQADELLRKGNTVDAIKQYENALDFVHKQPLLEEQKSHVLEKLARGYVIGNRGADAVLIYSNLLAEKKPNCKSEITADTDCASLQYSLGQAQINAFDFQGALSSFQSAEANYAKAAKVTKIHEIMMVYLKEQAQAKIYIAVALFRIGKTAEAIATIKAAIPLLNSVQSDENLQVSIRDDAKRSIDEAKTILARLESLQ